MGSCLFHPVSDVEQDPSVTSYTAVDDISVVRRVYSRRAQGGLMYIQGDSLHYETTHGTKLCCRCWKQSFPLAKIVKIDTHLNKTFSVSFSGKRDITLFPGLRIPFRDPDLVILVDMPDAVRFAGKLETTRAGQQREREAAEKSENLERRKRERAAKNAENVEHVEL